MHRRPGSNDAPGVPRRGSALHQEVGYEVPGSGLDRRLEADSPFEQDAAAPWLAALTAHVAVGALVALLAPGTPEPPSPPEPATLVVTLVAPEPEQAATAEPAPPADATAETSAIAAPTRFEVQTRVSAAMLEHDVLTSPESTTAAPPLPDSVRSTLASLDRCAATHAERGASHESCASVYAALAPEGLESDAHLDPTALELRGLAAAWATTTGYVASNIVDAAIFDGRGGGKPVVETTWAINAAANPLSADSRIFDPHTGEIGVVNRSAAP